MLDMRFVMGSLSSGDLGEAGDDRQLLSQIHHDIPIVVFCRGADTLGGFFSSIATDNWQGISSALDYLVSLGHNQIAFLGTSRSGDFHERLESYCRYMEQNLPGKVHLVQAENSMEGGYQGMQKILSLPEPPTAVLAADDVIATGALRAAAVHECKIPDEISLMGFDDIKGSAYMVPALTTIRQQVDVIGRAGLERMLALVASGGSLPPSHISVEPHLVVRESCAAPRQVRWVRCDKR